MGVSMQEMVNNAIALLPPAGEWVEFDEYKSNLYSSNPQNGRDVFAHLIRRELVLKRLDTNTDGKVVVFLSRLNMPTSSAVGKVSKK